MTSSVSSNPTSSASAAATQLSTASITPTASSSVSAAASTTPSASASQSTKPSVSASQSAAPRIRVSLGDSRVTEVSLELSLVGHSGATDLSSVSGLLRSHSRPSPCGPADTDAGTAAGTGVSQESIAWRSVPGPVLQRLSPASARFSADHPAHSSLLLSNLSGLCAMVSLRGAPGTRVELSAEPAGSGMFAPSMLSSSSDTTLYSTLTPGNQGSPMQYQQQRQLTLSAYHPMSSLRAYATATTAWTAWPRVLAVADGSALNISVPHHIDDTDTLHVMEQSTSSTAAVGSTFEFQLSGSQLLILRGADGSFMPGIRVWLRQYEADVLAVSRAGHMVAVRVPVYDMLCNGTACEVSGASPYYPLWLLNPVVSPVGWLSDSRHAWYLPSGMNDSMSSSAPLSQVDVSVGQALGAGSVCPHSCPGDGPSAAEDDVLATQAGYGFVLSKACAGYTAPGPACLTPGAHCAYGSGSNCKPCPSGAVCPGGFRQWALPGYWLPSEASTEQPMKCAEPAEQRCPGHDAMLKSSACGAGYAQQSIACSACDEGYFLTAASTCSPCSSVTKEASLWDIIVANAALLGWCVVGFVLAVALLHMLQCNVRANPMSSTKITASWALWCLSSLQMLAQVTTYMDANLPSFVQQAFSYAALALLDSDVLVQPACSHTPPLLWPTIRLGAMACGSVVWWILALLTRQPLHQHHIRWKWAHQVTAVVTMVLLIFYPLSWVQVTRMLRCESTKDSEVLISASGVTQVHSFAVWSLYGYDRLRCFAGWHAATGPLAIATMLLYCIGFPVFSFVHTREWLQASARAHMLAKPIQMSSSVNAFVKRSILPKFWHFYHRSMAISAIIAVSQFLQQVVPDQLALSIFLAAVCCLLLFAHAVHAAMSKPYNVRNRWKLPVEILATVAAGCAALMLSMSKAVSMQPDSSALPVLATSLTYLTGVLTMLLLVFLLGGFWWIQGAAARTRCFACVRTCRCPDIPMPRKSVDPARTMHSNPMLVAKHGSSDSQDPSDPQAYSSHGGSKFGGSGLRQGHVTMPIPVTANRRPAWLENPLGSRVETIRALSLRGTPSSTGRPRALGGIGGIGGSGGSGHLREFVGPSTGHWSAVLPDVESQGDLGPMKPRSFRAARASHR